jgi:hypothetical protein
MAPHRTRLPRKIFMRRVITRSMHRKFMHPAKVIQQVWKRYVKYRNVIDPITLDRIQHPIFVAVTPDGHEYCFSAVSLAMYIRESGDYRNPMTRAEFNQIEIQRLVRLSGITEILNVQERKEERAEQIQRNSLRAFFEEEVVASIETFLNYISTNSNYLNRGHMVRHLLALVFPTILVTIARTVRSDPEYTNELFEMLFTRENHIREALVGRPESTMRTIVVIYNQFLTDIQNQVGSGELLTGQTANIDVGGMHVRIDLGSI